MTDFEHDPSPQTFDGYRFFYIADGNRLVSPFRSDADLAEMDFTAECQTYDHPAPNMDCSCGLWVAESPASLLTVALTSRDYPRLPAIVSAAVAAEDRGEDFRIPTPVLAHVRAFDSLPVTGEDNLKKSRVVWELIGKRQANHGWHPELGVFRRAARVELLDLHIGAHDLTASELSALRERYGVPLTEHRKPAHTSAFRLRIGGRERPIVSPERALSEYEIVKRFVPAGDPVERQMRSFGLLP